MALIYKICPEQDWTEAQRAGAYRGSGDDHRDGFIHFSTADQVPGTLARHFAGKAGLVLIAVDEAAAGPALRWEASRGGTLFPHLHGTLPVTAARAVHPLPLGPDGRHLLPDLA